VGYIPQEIFSVFFPYFECVNFDFLPFGKFFNLFHQSPHIGGHRFGRKGGGFQEGHIIINSFDTSIYKMLNPYLDDGKTDSKTYQGKKYGMCPLDVFRLYLKSNEHGCDQKRNN
tara:strand:- start:1497 stop:1838 length:342 start_codon:yes stop_codon:yes gene_type:complete